MKNLYKCISGILIIFLTIGLILYPMGLFAVVGADADIVYAELNIPVMLYSKNEETLEYSPLTLLPPTYFVALLEDEQSVSEYIHVVYNDLTGYVKKSEITICDYEPVTKYALGNLTLSFDNQPVNLRSSPNHLDESNIIRTIASNTKVLYYGTVEGSSLYPQLGNSWYYIKYSDGETIYRGYIYSVQGIAEKIPNNVIEKVVKPPPSSEPDPNVAPPAMIIDDLTTTIIICCLTVPAILIMLLLFQRPQKAKRKPRHF